MTQKKMGQLVRRTKRWFGQPGMDCESAFFKRWSSLLADERKKEIDSQRRWKAANKEKHSKWVSAYRAKRRLDPKWAEREREKCRISYQRNIAKRREEARTRRAITASNPILKAAVNEWKRNWRKRKEIVDPQFRIRRQIRTRIWMAINKAYGKKAHKTFELIGCSREEFLAHIQSTWQHGMSWENYGRRGWHIDHKIPCEAFDLTNPEEQKKCFHFTNTQALWAKDNLSKGAKMHLQLELL